MNYDLPDNNSPPPLLCPITIDDDAIIPLSIKRNHEKKSQNNNRHLNFDHPTVSDPNWKPSPQRQSRQRPVVNKHQKTQQNQRRQSRPTSNRLVGVNSLLLDQLAAARAPAIAPPSDFGDANNLPPHNPKDAGIERPKQRPPPRNEELKELHFAYDNRANGVFQAIMDQINLTPRFTAYSDELTEHGGALTEPTEEAEKKCYVRTVHVTNSYCFGAFAATRVYSVEVAWLAEMLAANGTNMDEATRRALFARVYRQRLSYQTPLTSALEHVPTDTVDFAVIAAQARDVHRAWALNYNPHYILIGVLVGVGCIFVVTTLTIRCLRWSYARLSPVLESTQSVISSEVISQYQQICHGTSQDTSWPNPTQTLARCWRACSTALDQIRRLSIKRSAEAYEPVYAPLLRRLLRR